jgi:purine-nucleoside phosphorylase
MDELGPRFPDMSRPYDPFLNEKIKRIAGEHGVKINEGVYVSVPGPNLETRAEYRYLRMIGGDAVGMSTVPEVIVCNHMSLPCCCISVLTDECNPDSLSPVKFSEIIQTAMASEKNLTAVYMQLIKELD